jgi:hypothetical protein
MDYKIIYANAELGQIEVLYSKDGKKIGVFSVDVPIIDGAYLTGTALEQEILSRAPVWVVARNEEVKTASGFAEIQALVQTLPVEPINPEVQANAKMWAQVEFEKKIAKALVKFGVLQSDPTAIEVTQL